MDLVIGAGLVGLASGTCLGAWVVCAAQAHENREQSRRNPK
ncbi:hypothetical protein [Kineococcus terrestris]